MNASPCLKPVARSNPERTAQIMLCKHIALRKVPGLWWTHIPNGGSRNIIEASLLKKMGTLAGVPDLLFLLDGNNYWLELKAAGGRLSAAQRACGEAIKAAGGKWTTAFGLDDAIETLLGWGLIK